MARVLERLLTIEDWLAYEGEPHLRYELFDGRLVAMSPPKTWHGTITNEIGRLCSEALRDRFPCRALQGPGLVIRREPKAKGYIPDVVATCEPIEENRAAVAEPRLVVEVLSASTGGVDKRAKFQDYRGLTSVEEVWLVDSRARRVRQAVRLDDGSWGERKPFIGKASFESPVLGVAVALDDIYRYTPFGQPAEEPDPS